MSAVLYNYSKPPPHQSAFILTTHAARCASSPSAIPHPISLPFFLSPTSRLSQRVCMCAWQRCATYGITQLLPCLHCLQIARSTTIRPASISTRRNIVRPREPRETPALSHINAFQFFAVLLLPADINFRNIEMYKSMVYM